MAQRSDLKDVIKQTALLWLLFYRPACYEAKLFGNIFKTLNVQPSCTAHIPLSKAHPHDHKLQKLTNSKAKQCFGYITSASVCSTQHQPAETRMPVDCFDTQRSQKRADFWLVNMKIKVNYLVIFCSLSGENPKSRTVCVFFPPRSFRFAPTEEATGRTLAGTKGRGSARLHFFWRDGL